MARVRTGPRGHELLDRSIGEAAARIDGLSALGRLSALRVPGIDAGAVAVGAGPIERRQATPAELAAIAARDSRPPVLPVRAKDPAYRLERIRATPTRPEEESVTTPVPPPFDVPCGTCLHEPVCGIRKEIPDAPGEPLSAILAPGLRLLAVGYRIDCDHYLGEPAAAPRLVVQTADAIAASRRNGAAATSRLHAQRRASRVTDEAIVDALRAAGGNRARAALAVELSRAELGRRVGVMKAAGTLPDHVEAMLTSKPGTRKAVAS